MRLGRPAVKFGAGSESPLDRAALATGAGSARAGTVHALGSEVPLRTIINRQLVAHRRFIALVLSASLLHLSSARADAVCTEHSAATGATPTHHERVAPGDHLGHSADGIEEEACETPALPECCQALATCSITLGSRASLRVDEAHRLHVSVAPALETAPLSRVTTPDPPPPKV